MSCQNSHNAKFTFIHVNTKFRSNYYTTSSTDFNYQFPNSYSNVNSLKLDSICIPNTWYLFSSKKKNNVFILRTFSKIYGLASLRVGWGYGSKEIVKALMNIKPPFNITKIGELSAIEALRDKIFISKSIKHNKKWGEKLKRNLEKNNINTNKVSANFLLLNFDKCKISALKFKKKLEEKGIIVRSLEVYGMKNKLRVTIGNSKENNFFLKTVKSIF